MSTSPVSRGTQLSQCPPRGLVLSEPGTDPSKGPSPPADRRSLPWAPSLGPRSQGVHLAQPHTLLGKSHGRRWGTPGLGRPQAAEITTVPGSSFPRTAEGPHLGLLRLAGPGSFQRRTTRAPSHTTAAALPWAVCRTKREPCPGEGSPFLGWGGDGERGEGVLHTAGSIGEAGPPKE